MAKRWIKERKKDHYYRKAKEEQYRSRASFKLMQINEKFKVIKRGDRVLDLGAAPGGWMQAARKAVGDKGFVLGVDLQDIAPFKEDNVKSIKGDITEKETLKKIKSIIGNADVIISDASPDISGVWGMDHHRSIELCRSALGIAREVLKPEGNLLVKIFQGGAMDDFLAEMKREFEHVKTTKPKASRSKSSEMYAVGKGFLKTPVRYGDVFEVNIEDTGKEGDGLCYVNGFPVFVKGARRGEKKKIKIKKVNQRFAIAGIK